MSTQRNLKYVIDSDVLMQAHRSYYAFDICSGFWGAILLHHANSIVVSIDKVLDEINDGNQPDALKEWAKTKVPDNFFITTKDTDVVQAYAEVNRWVNGKPYTQEAIAGFMAVADPWLIAFAKAKQRIVVTQEVSKPNRTSEVKIPDVCSGVGVLSKNTFDFLRDFDIDFKL